MGIIVETMNSMGRFIRPLCVFLCTLYECAHGGGGGGKTKHVAPNYPSQFNATIYLNNQPYRGGVWYDKIANRAAEVHHDQFTSNGHILRADKMKQYVLVSEMC